MKLTFTTVELPASDFDLLAHLPEQALCFIRGGNGIIGWGEAVRLQSTKPAGRIADLANQWRALTETAAIHDPLQFAGTGMVAFGTLAFSDSSSAASVLIVPKVIVGLRDGVAWLTTVEQHQAPEFWTKPATYPTNSKLEFQPGETDATKFKTIVSQAIDAIKTKRIEKVVLSRDIVAPVPKNFDVRSVLVSLANEYPTCWIYSIDGMFGASPELLVRVSHGQVSARVLAGTAARGTDPEVDQAISAALASSSKNNSEHAFAVNSLVRALEPFCDHVDADTEPFSMALPNLWHLASDVHGVLNQQSSVLDLAAALHPTAAVAGTPTDQAKTLIAELEQNDRGRYAGPIGWIGADGDGEWAIALRGAQLANDRVRAFAGCGIVAESDAQAELDETELKFKPIRNALS